MHERAGIARHGGDRTTQVMHVHFAHRVRHRGRVVHQYIDQCIVERVEDAFESPMIVDGQTITVGASAGYVLVDDPTVSRDEVLALADAAMYRDKRRLRVAAPEPLRRHG